MSEFKLSPAEKANILRMVNNMDAHDLATYDRVLFRINHHFKGVLTELVEKRDRQWAEFVIDKGLEATQPKGAIARFRAFWRKKS